MSAQKLNFTSPTAIEDIAKLLKTGNVVVFVGSGLSTPFYPSWVKLISELCNETGVSISEKLTKDTPAELLMQYAEKAQKSDPKKYEEILTKHFGAHKGSTPDTYHLLLQSPFKSILTINFDPLLARAIQLNQVAFELEAYPYQEVKDLILKQMSFYLHGIHENFREKSKIILSKSDFNEAYNKHSKLIHFLSTVFDEYHILFVGCSLSEPEFQTLLTECFNSESFLEREYGITSKKRFILRPGISSKSEDPNIQDEENKKAKLQRQKEKEHYDNLGIKAVFYNEANDHKELTEILEYLSNIPSIQDQFTSQPLEYKTP